jgi:thiol-disulfide isomerase/thioredoxin
MTLRVRPRTMARSLVLGLAALLLASAPAAADKVEEGSRAPELDIAKTEAGKAFKLKAYKGKWMFVTFGGSWCKPCAKELPAWDKLQPKYGKKLKFVAINIDNDMEKGKKFFAKLKIKNLMRVYLPADSASGDDNYETGVFPSTFVIDPQGIVRHVHKGFSSGDDDDMAKKLDELLDL